MKDSSLKEIVFRRRRKKKPYIFITPKVFKVFDEDDIFMFSFLEIFSDILVKIFLLSNTVVHIFNSLFHANGSKKDT